MKIDEVYFFRFSTDRIRGMWGLEDTWTRIRQLTGENIQLGELGSLSDPVTDWDNSRWPHRPDGRPPGRARPHPENASHDCAREQAE